MLKPTKTAAAPALELLGELHPLMVQLGSADGLVTLGTAATAVGRPRVDSPAALTAFLEAYLAQILLPFELPAICRAFHHTARNEARELVALDRELAGNSWLQDFAAASQRVGRSQLERLRPLRDERVVRRYLLAVEEGQAHGWHTLVFGLTLAVYSLPVRQGLLTYARQTVRGFIQAAARPLRLTPTQSHDLFERLCGDLPRRLEPVVAQEHAVLASGPQP